MKKILIFLSVLLIGCSPKTYTYVIEKCQIVSISQEKRYDVTYTFDYVYHTDCGVNIYETGSAPFHFYNVGDSIPVKIYKIK